MTRFLLLGDTHGYTQHIAKAAKAANRFDCEFIVQLGDWGFIWPTWTKTKFDQAKGQWVKTPQSKLLPWDYRVKKLTNVLKQFDQKMFFIDGNHEDFPTWEQNGIDIHGEHPQIVSERLTYLPRGYSWVWDDVRFLALGGAVSVDKEARTAEEWFPAETIKDRDIQRAVSVGKVDVLLTHDTVDMPFKLHEHCSRQFGFSKLNDASQTHRRRLNYVVRHTRPAINYHGHYHVGYSENWEGMLVRGLSLTGRGGNDAYWVFDTEDFKEGRQR